MFPFQFKDKSQPILKNNTFSLWLKVLVACVPLAIIGALLIGAELITLIIGL
jgi:undecaprenyl-diphosphatase